MTLLWKSRDSYHHDGKPISIRFRLTCSMFFWSAYLKIWQTITSLKHTIIVCYSGEILGNFQIDSLRSNRDKHNIRSLTANCQMRIHCSKLKNRYHRPKFMASNWTYPWLYTLLLVEQKYVDLVVWQVNDSDKLLFPFVRLIILSSSFGIWFKWSINHGL